LKIKLGDLIGKRFKDGGRGPDEYDCYGLGMEVFRRCGVELLDYAGSCYDKESINATYLKWRGQWERVQGEPPAPALIVMKANSAFFINHVGVYLGAGKFIHAIDKKDVVIENVSSPEYRRIIKGYYVPKWVKQ
jgi:cell wall-associated NlpC family hydrolase